MSAAEDWRWRGWNLAEFYAADTHAERGFPDDDALRIAVVREHYPGSMPSARTHLREGWRLHRAGCDIEEMRTIGPYRLLVDLRAMP